MAPAWYIDKALEDYINTPADKGHLETIHPDTTYQGVPAASSAGVDSTSTGTFPTGFTMEFDYSFETSRNAPYGYVQALPDPFVKRISFVGNSGVKFGGMEAAILDVSSMVGLGGGWTAFYPYAGIYPNGNVDLRPSYDPEPLKKLMTGVKYGGNYENMTDYNAVSPSVPPVVANFYDTLRNNAGHSNSHMKIEAIPIIQGTFLVNIYLDGSLTYSETNATLAGLGTLVLQSHWGSGVVFSNLRIS